MTAALLHGFVHDDPRGDASDWVLPRSVGVVSAAPDVTRNRDLWLPPARDQRKSNFCVNFEVTNAVSHAEARQLRDRIGMDAAVAELSLNGYADYSPLFNGYLSRDPAERPLNVGTQVRRGLDAARKWGVATSSSVPWELESADDYLQRMSKEPPREAYIEALHHQTVFYYRVPDGDLEALDRAITAGFGVVIGIPWMQSMFDAKADGVVPAPAGSLAGWHAVYPYDRDRVNGKRKWWSPNSWGTAFGKEGYCYFGEEHLSSFEDGWVVATAEVVVVS